MLRDPCEALISARAIDDPHVTQGVSFDLQMFHGASGVRDVVEPVATHRVVYCDERGDCRCVHPAWVQLLLSHDAGPLSDAEREGNTPSLNDRQRALQGARDAG